LRGSLPKVFAAQAEIQRQVRPRLPVVLDEQAPLTREVAAVLAGRRVRRRRIALEELRGNRVRSRRVDEVHELLRLDRCEVLAWVSAAVK
jgi:hypothetical protein